MVLTGPTTTWRNWGGNQRATPAEVAHPRDVEETATLVKAAAASGRRVKAIGSGHSFTAIGVTDGLHLHLDRQGGLVDIDLDTGLVTVGAGMQLRTLNALLASRGRALANLGDIDTQTISGAISTGTHGTGARLTGIAAQVAGLDLVLADGSVLACSATEHADVFAAARIGLGALGVLATVTLATVPAFHLRASEGSARLGDVLESFDADADGNDHYEFFWFPHTDRVLTKRNNRVRDGEPLAPLGRVRSWVEDDLLSNKVFGLSNRLGRRYPALIPGMNAAAGRALSSREFTGPSHEVFCSSRHVRFVEMEHAVPRADAPDVLREIRSFIDSSDLRISFPVEVRVAAADDVTLSTASDRKSAYVAVHMFQGMPYERYFAGVEAICAAVGGRPHWGKLHTRTAEQLAAVYPRFGEFTALRDRLDPQRVFTNDYLDRVLGA